ncbi:MAG: M28 family metallopeptidase, partial [Candidatus Thorarchaeota archaeon]
IIFILSIINIFTFKGFFIISLILLMLGIPTLFSLFFFVSFGEKANKVPGAVDNLSAVAILLGLGQFIKKNREIIPKNTEIRLISFGCEEAGLRGAYRYVESHLDEFNKYDAECVNMDSIQTPNSFSIIDFEPSTRTKHSDVVVQKLIKAAQNSEIKVKVSGLGGSKLLEKVFGQITGGTDATAFSKLNIKAATISAMNLKRMLEIYHQPTDTLDKIEKGALENALRLCVNYLILDPSKK